MRRSKPEIIADMLRVAARSKEGELKTYIMNRTMLNYERLEKYLNFLQEVDLLEKVENDKMRYKVTRRGYKFLENFKSIKEILNEMGGRK